jgi:hypothetical protein
LQDIGAVDAGGRHFDKELAGTDLWHWSFGCLQHLRFSRLDDIDVSHVHRTCLTIFGEAKADPKGLPRSIFGVAHRLCGITIRYSSLLASHPATAVSRPCGIMR